MDKIKLVEEIDPKQSNTTLINICNYM